MDKKRLMAELIRLNKPDAPIVKTDLWAFMEKQGYKGKESSIEVIDSYLRSKGSKNNQGLFEGNRDILEILLTISRHHGQKKARENCKNCQ